jgi:hypothetical protein
MSLWQPPPELQAHLMGVPHIWAYAGCSPLSLLQTYPGAAVWHYQGSHVPCQLPVPHKSVQEGFLGPVARS